MGCLECLKDARVAKRIHAWAAVFWLLNLVGAGVMFFGFHRAWEHIATFYLVVVSIYANVVSHWGAYQGAGAEVAQVAG